MRLSHEPRMGDDGAGCRLAALQTGPQTFAARNRGDRRLYEGIETRVVRRRTSGSVTFVLDHIGLEAGGVEGDRRRLPDVRTRQPQRPARPDARRQDDVMRLMAGLDRPTTGRLLLDGRDVTGRSVRERSVAMVYQQFINYPSLSVYENIASPLRVARLGVRARSTRACARRRGCCGWKTCCSACRASFPAASSNAPPSRARSSSARVSFCSTSRSPISTTNCARNCARNCRAFSRRPARFWSMPRPSRPRRCCSAAPRPR